MGVTPGDILNALKDMIAEGVITPELVFNYTVPEGFDKLNGKFTNSLGNLAIADCHSLGTMLANNLYSVAASMSNTIKYFLFAGYVEDIAKQLAVTDMCQYAMTIEGVLKDAIEYYTIDDSNKMKGAIIRQGRDVMSRLTLNTNATISTPVLDSLKQVDMVRVFLNSSLSTVVFFLAILSVQLIYSLMLSDVDEKTYQYGMLRALGFRN